MIMKGVVMTLLLCLDRATADRVQDPRESSEELTRYCCIRDIDGIDDGHRTGCNFEDAKDASRVTPYDTFVDAPAILCCVTCLQKMFGKKVKAGRTEAEAEEEEDGEVEKGRISSVEATTKPQRSCFEACRPTDRSVVEMHVEERETEWTKNDSSDGAVTLNNTVAIRAAHCDSIFTSLNFWGANIVIFANAIYIVPYVIVVFVFVIVPGLSARAYNKAVICYNITQIILNGILIGIGACALCHVSIYSHVYVILGLTLMFLTISSTNWLLMICIDMTLAITRFRRASANDSPTSYREAEKKKFLMYAVWTWGGSLIPTALACVAELSPLLPKSSPVRPNFDKFEDGANLTVILCVATIPALTCLANTVLFFYTSYKMIRIQKSAKFAVTNSNKAKINTARKRYFLFLRLYLLMDAPWVTSALAAAITDLWILKFLRMIQPILMLLAVLPSRTTNRVSTRGHAPPPYEKSSSNRSSRFDPTK